MTRSVKQQYITFWFVLNEQPLLPDTTDSEHDAAYATLYPTWNKACALIELAQAQHPLYRFQELHGDSVLDFENWEFCEQDPIVEAIDGKLAWPIAFYHTKALPRMLLETLRDLCVAGFASACAETGCTARLAKVETNTEYVETVNEVVEGL